MAMKIKQNDEVIVIAGKDKGKKGKVIKTLTEQGRVVVEGINLVTRHQKKNRASRAAGQIIKKAMPINVSNVSLLEDDKPVRVGYIFTGEGKERKKIRVARPSGNKI